MTRDVFTSISHPVGDTFSAPQAPDGATCVYSLIGSHSSHDGAEVVTIWRSSVVEVEPTSDTEPAPPAAP